MDRMNVNAPSFALYSQAGGQLRDTSLCAAVHDRERVRNEPRRRARKDNAALEALADEIAVKVVGQVQIGCQVAVEVRQVSLNGMLLEESSDYVTCVVEEELHV